MAPPEDMHPLQRLRGQKTEGRRQQPEARGWRSIHRGVEVVVVSGSPLAAKPKKAMNGPTLGPPFPIVRAPGKDPAGVTLTWCLLKSKSLILSIVLDTVLLCCCAAPLLVLDMAAPEPMLAHVLHHSHSMALGQSHLCLPPSRRQLLGSARVIEDRMPVSPVPLAIVSSPISPVPTIHPTVSCSSWRGIAVQNTLYRSPSPTPNNAHTPPPPGARWGFLSPPQHHLILDWQPQRYPCFLLKPIPAKVQYMGGGSGRGPRDTTCQFNAPKIHSALYPSQTRLGPWTCSPLDGSDLRQPRQIIAFSGTKKQAPPFRFTHPTTCCGSTDVLDSVIFDYCLPPFSPFRLHSPTPTATLCCRPAAACSPSIGSTGKEKAFGHFCIAASQTCGLVAFHIAALVSLLRLYYCHYYPILTLSSPHNPVGLSICILVSIQQQ
ncbi:hypothetical protein SODALDRAFT_363887 [Sodiomyces alkalinus F11]|uniref:Uncharacterized protein n=1 Tax=Sodiomyces alkalinus (strain CBS 110278 / VKM F-3762 / F11) TaxID=1314773 RepID=A0A3N2PLH3_SODAK|nr:hypothetical protein SODALDRAFT_363887 [Sodiomyces alkalinus F11]ROT35196.1 hypothetical protein SODALDRAFT_363887 [Sodiomyces alkalinus F11]